MNYIILIFGTLVFIFGICFLITTLIRKRMEKKLPMALHILISIGAGLLLCAVTVFAYLTTYAAADTDAVQALNDPSVEIKEIDAGYFIDGPGKDTALIFYPGAKVDTAAYLPLMEKTASNGVDCYLLNVSMHMAIFDRNAADKVMGSCDYETVLVGGHSMGGMIAAEYAVNHTDTVDGVVLLSSYALHQLSEPMRALSVYGTEDEVLGDDEYELEKTNFPPDTTEKVIEGGNHAQFGNYGEQSGDGKATISAEEQQSQTALAIAQFAKKFAQ